MRKYVKSNDGYALVIALLVITVVTVLGLGILTTTSSSKKLSEEENKDQTAYYIAEAGLNQKKEELKEIPNLYNEYIKNKDIKKMKEADIIKAFLKEIKNKPILNKETIYREDIFKRKNAEAKVIVTIPSETELKFTITSTGIIKSNDSTNEKKRTVQSVDSYDLIIIKNDNATKPSKYVLHSLGNLTIKNGTIVGNLGFSKDLPPDLNRNYPFGSSSNNVSYQAGNPKITYKPCKKNNTCNDIYTAIKNNVVTFGDKTLPISSFPENKFINLNQAIQPPKIGFINGIPDTSVIPSGNYILKSSELKNLNIGSNKVNLFLTDINEVLLERDLKFMGNGTLNIYGQNIKQTKSLDANEITLNIYSKDNFIFSKSASILNIKNLNIFSNNITFEDSSNVMKIQNEFNLYAYDKFTVPNSQAIATAKSKAVYYSGNASVKYTSNLNGYKLDFLQQYLDLNNNNINNIHGTFIFRKNITKATLKLHFKNSSYTPLYLYAPNYDINIIGNTVFYGAILGKDITTNGSVKVTFVAPSNDLDEDNSTGSDDNPMDGSIDSSLTPNSDGGSVEVNNP